MVNKVKNKKHNDYGMFLVLVNFLLPAPHSVEMLEEDLLVQAVSHCILVGTEIVRMIGKFEMLQASIVNCMTQILYCKCCGHYQSHF